MACRTLQQPCMLLLTLSWAWTLKFKAMDSERKLTEPRPAYPWTAEYLDRRVEAVEISIKGEFVRENFQERKKGINKRKKVTFEKCVRQAELEKQSRRSVGHRHECPECKNLWVRGYSPFRFGWCDSSDIGDFGNAVLRAPDGKGTPVFRVVLDQDSLKEIAEIAVQAKVLPVDPLISVTPKVNR